MNVITDATASLTANRAAIASPDTGERTRAAPSDYNTFLRMLTVQMQNQDPLNPIDSADYAVQLATFSGVEQQTRTNQTLETMLQRMERQGMGEMSGWVDREVKSPAAIGFKGVPVDLDLPGDPRADRAVLTVHDAFGTLLAREEVPPRGGPYQWQGKDITGDALPRAGYTLAVEHYVGEAAVRSTPLQSWQRVTEVGVGASGLVLRLEDGSEVAASAVTALRSAG